VWDKRVHYHLGRGWHVHRASQSTWQRHVQPCATGVPELQSVEALDDGTESDGSEYARVVKDSWCVKQYEEVLIPN
jgi:hypothetical protein